MSLSITVTYPTPGARLKPSFPVCGTYANTLMKKDGYVDRNALLSTSISVMVTKGSSSWGPFSATLCSSTLWQATVSGIPAGNGYTVTATITDGTNSTSNSVSTVDVTNDTIIVIPVTCCPEVGAPLLGPFEKATSVSLAGTYTAADATELLAIVQEIVVTQTDTRLPSGGRHHHVTYQPGSHLRGKAATLDRANKKWEVTLDVDFQTIVHFFLKRGDEFLASTTSPLF